MLLVPTAAQCKVDTLVNFSGFTKNIVGKYYGPYPETAMRRWWSRHDFGQGPDLLVKLPTWPNFLKLHTIYDLGVPPTWRPTATLSEFQGSQPQAAEPASSSRRSPLPEEATNPDPRATRADAIGIGTDNQRPAWIKSDGTVITQEQLVAEEQGSDDDASIHEDMDDDEQSTADCEGPDDEAQVPNE